MLCQKLIQNFSGYQKQEKILPSKNDIVDGLKELKKEILLWRDEMKEKFEDDPVLIYRPGEIDVAYRFKGNSLINQKT